MKKSTYLLTLLLTALLCLPWGSSAWGEQLNEGFEGSTFVPEGWSTIHVSGYASWEQYTGTYYNNGYNSKSSAKVSWGPADNYLITPQLRPADGEKLTFYAASTNYGGSTLEIMVSTTNNTSASSFSSLSPKKSFSSNSTSIPNGSWNQIEIDLSAYVGQDIYIAFHVTDNDGDAIYIDDVAGISLKPETCPKTNAPTASNIGETTATISWTAIGTEDTWNLRYKKSSASEWTYANGLTSTTYDLTDLTAGGTSYDYEVQADCGGSETSDWKAGTPFQTDCGIIKTLPWTYGFEASEGAVANSTPTCWNSLRTNTNFYLPVVYTAGYRSGSQSLRFYGSGSTAKSVIVLPKFSTDIRNLKLSFYYQNASTATSRPQFQVGYVTDPTDISTFVSLASLTRKTSYAATPAPYKLEDFTAAPTGAYIAICYTGGSTDANAYIDDITVESIQDCSAPQGVEAAQSGTGEVTATWTANAGVDSYQYCIVARGAEADWSGNLTTSTNSVKVGELAAGDYDFYVRCVCGGDASDAVAFTIESCQAISDVAHTSDVFNGTTVTWANGGSGPWAVAYSLDGENWTTVNASVAARSCAVTGLTPGTTYTIKVSSDCTEATTTYTPTCPALGALTLSGKKYNGVTVSWSAVAGISTWNLRYRKGSDSWTEVNDITELTYTIESGLATNEEYTIELYSECGGSPATITYTPIFAVPSGATVLTIKDVTASASWSIVDGASGYQYSCVPTGSPASWSATTTGNGPITLSGLTAAESYDFSVRAVFGASGYSEPKVKTFTTVCQAPTSLVKGETSSSSLAFSWSKSANGVDNRYQYVCKEGSTAPTDAQWTADGVLLDEGVRTATVEGLSANTTYYFFVRSYYADGKYSTALSGNNKTDCGIYNLPFSENFSGSSQPNCWTIANWGTSANSWTLASENAKTGNALRYYAKTYSSCDVVSPSIYIDDKAELSFYVRNYYYYYSAYYIAGNVVISDGVTNKEVAYGNNQNITQKTVDLSEFAGKTVTITFQGKGATTSTNAYLWIDDVDIHYLPIAEPTNLATLPTPDGAIVTWSHDEDGPFDLQYREKDADPEADWISVEDITAKTYTLTGLTVGKEYEVQVRADISEHRISDWTSSAVFTPECSAPVGMTKTAETYNSVTLEWTGDADALRYKTDGEWTTVDFDPAQTSHTLTNLTTGVTYTIQVRATCGEKWSEDFGFTPTYVAPSNVEVSNITATSADIAWTVNSGEASWTLRYKKTADDGWTTVENVTNPYTLTGLTSSTNYQVQVAAGTLYSGTASFLTECGILTPLGYTEGFEEMETGSYADDKLRCWETLNAVHTGDFNPPYVYVGTDAQNGSKGMTFRGSPSTYIYAILPEFSGSYEGLQLAFSHKEENSSNSGYIFLGFMTDPTDATTFESLMSEITSTRSTSWKDVLVSLNTVPADARLAFRYGGGSNNWDAYVDDIAITEIPDCAIPTGLEATNINTSGATLSWTSDADKWTVQYSTSSEFRSFTQDPNITDNPHTLTGLLPNTLYYVRVKADCGSGNESEWSVATSFRTECEVKTVAEGSPWTEDFTSGHAAGEAPYCWETIPAENNSSTYTQVTADGELVIYQHYSNTEIAVLPEFSTDIKNLRISFKYRNRSDYSNYASLEVGYVVGTTFHPVQTLAKTTNSTRATDIEMPADAITTARIAFRLTNTKNYDSYVYVDDIEVALKETCKTPVNVQRTVLTDEGATFTWEASELGETQYQYACVDADAVLQESDWILLADGLSTVTITGKTVGNSYDFYVRSYCAADKQSRPTAKVTFSPVCAGLATPTVSAVTNSSATITWVGNAKNLQYRIYDAETPAEWNTEAIPAADKATPFALSSLEPNTKYEVRVQSFCAATDDELWSSVASFTTWCGLRDAAELPLEVNSFTSVPECWEATFKGAYSAVSGNKICFYGTEEQMLVLPAYDIDLNKLSVTFTFTTSGATPQFGYLDEPNGTFHAFGSTLTSGVELDLSGETTGVKYIAVNYPGGSSDYSFVNISAVSLRKTPTCSKLDAPTATPAVGGASISWTAGAESAWNLQYKSASATEWTDATGTITNPYVISGLEQGVSYKVRVQADCGAGDLGDWSDETLFTTDCDAITAIPFTEGFDAALSNCWTVHSDNTTAYASQVYGSELRLPGGKSNAGHVVVLPEITADLSKATLTLRYRCEAGANNATPKVGYVTDRNDKETFSVLKDAGENEIGALDKSATAKTVRLPLATLPSASHLALSYAGGTTEGTLTIEEVRISRVEIFEDRDNASDNETRLGALKAEGGVLDVILERSLWLDNEYATISLPFSLSAVQLNAPDCPLFGFNIREYKQSEVNLSENIVDIYLQDAGAITAGKAYFIRREGSGETLNPLEFRDVTVTSSEPQVSGDANLQVSGLFNPLAVEQDDYNTLFVGSGNKLYYPNVAGYIKGFRAFLKVPGGSPMATPIRRGAQVRISEQKNTPTGINDVLGDSNKQSLKVLENGHVVIIRNGVKYSVTGQKIQ